MPTLRRMRGILKLAACTGLMLSLFFGARADVSLEFGKDVNDAKVKKAEGGVWSLETSGADPYAFFDMARKPKRDETVLEFEYFCPDGIDSFGFFYGPPMNEKTYADLGPLAKAEGWQKASFDLKGATRGAWNADFKLFRLDFGTISGVRLQMRNIRLRAPNAEEVVIQKKREAQRGELVKKAEKYAAYYAAKFPAKISSVKVFEKELELDVSGVPSKYKDVKLGRIALWEDAFDKSAKSEFFDIPADGTVKIPRFGADGRDSILSKFSVYARANSGAEYEPLSHAAYAENFDAVRAEIEPKKVHKSKKGLTCVSNEMRPIFGEIAELGVKHVTLNVLLNGLLSTPQGAGVIEHEFSGRNIRLNRHAVEALDELAKLCSDNSAITSGIILINFGAPEFTDGLIHPAADKAGVYAMPNLADENGTLLYAAVMDFLCKRYAEKGAPHGRIDNWIMHNEVDYAWVWTNMGESPMEIFMEQYMRSMRLVSMLARQYNPDARVFISLTHNWNQNANDKTFRTHSPRMMLDYLALCSAKSGDFDWGVAYHPYPQNLFVSTAWLDAIPQMSFDTPLITMKNIEVLFAYLNKKEFLRNGKARTVIFSEQGYHTDYTPEGFENQGAAFAYTWRRISNLENLEAFHNHRWIDHPDEGGLHLGLRTIPKGGAPFGDKKPGWETYRLLDTPKEAELFKKYEKLIGKKLFVPADIKNVKK